MNKTGNTQKSNLTKQNSVDILFKGLKRQINQRSYSKLKNSYKKKSIQIRQLQAPQTFIPAPTCRTKLKLSIISNKITDPQVAHDELIKLKQANHQLFEQNTQLLRKIRKQQKIEEIYRKKIQGQQLIDLQYSKVMEIKLLLQVQRLENQLEDKQKLFEDKVETIRSKKNIFKNQIVERRIQLYELMINSQQQLKRTLKDKKIILTRNEQKIDILRQNFLKSKSKKQQQNQILNEIKNEIKQLKQKFKVQQALTKRDQSNNAEMLNITNLMSNLITGSQKSQLTKQASTAMLKNNMSSISIKNKNSIQQIQKEIQKIKQQYDMLNNQIQQFMDEKIKQKLLINKEMTKIDDVYKGERDDQNRRFIGENSALMKKDSVGGKSGRVNNGNNNQTSLKCSLVISS